MRSAFPSRTTNIADHDQKSAKKAPAEEASRLDDELTDALESTFPASDPFNVGNATAQPERPVDRRPPAVDAELVKRLASKLDRKA